jgi:hypothetical protein
VARLELSTRWFWRPLHFQLCYTPKYWSRRSDSNRDSPLYESDAFPLSYVGLASRGNYDIPTIGLKIRGSSFELPAHSYTTPEALPLSTGDGNHVVRHVHDRFDTCPAICARLDDIKLAPVRSLTRFLRTKNLIIIVRLRVPPCST